MTFEDFHKDYCQRFQKRGSFELRRGENIRRRAIAKGVPDEPSVYLIFDSPGGKLLYIGKAGTLQRNGIFKKQKLIGRLSAKQKRMRRQEFYEKKMDELQLDALVFYWFVTYVDDVQIIPAKAEADLLQAYYDENGHLPEWNETF